MPDYITFTLEIIAALAAIGGAVYKWIFIPIKSILAKLEEFKALEAKVDKLNEDNKATMLCLASMANHMIEGNHVDKLKADRDELLKHIANN